MFTNDNVLGVTCVRCRFRLTSRDGLHSRGVSEWYCECCDLSFTTSVNLSSALHLGEGESDQKEAA